MATKQITATEKVSIGMDICRRIWDQGQNLTVADVRTIYKLASDELSENTLDMFANDTLVIAAKGKQYVMAKSLNDFALAIGSPSLAKAF